MRPADILVAITGASGVIYGIRLVEVLSSLGKVVDAIITENAIKVAEYELGIDLVEEVKRHARTVYRESQLEAPYSSSSSAPKEAMVIAPCSMKTLSAIAHGYADNLVVRAALAVLRLHRPLVLVVRETPLGLPELFNMFLAAMAGAIILPAMPAFYHKPKTIKDIVDFIVGKVLDVLNIEHDLYKRWRA